MTREQTIQTIQDNPEISVLIIGGGVNGIGTFRDLAMQGVDVLLVEKADFCSGASAASSHMVHGGLRYLENAEFRLVKEALTERNRLLQNAPHQVFPLPTTIPIFHWFSGVLNAPLKFVGLRDKPSNRGVIVIKIGLTLYDWFTRGQQTLPRHKLISRPESLQLRPKLNPKIVRTATYYDAWMPSPERICTEMLTDAQAASSTAHALNYMTAVDAGGDSVKLEDQMTGAQYTIKPKIVINAAGPWIDFANSALGYKTNFIGGTKGSHLVLDHPELHAATNGHEMFFENADGRITLFFPLGERVLVGTTDIRIDDPEQAVCTEDEVDYMLHMINIVFPDIRVDHSQIVFRFTGVRPLPSSEASTTGKISRDHNIETIPAGEARNFPIHSLIGGKWTTFRAFSEQVTDKVLNELGKSRKVSTGNIPIAGGKDYPKTNPNQWLEQQQKQTGLPLERLETLFKQYGTQAAEIAQFIAQGEDAPLNTLPDYSRREIIYIAQNESVVHLDDFLLRRSLIAMLGYVTPAVLDEAAGILAQALGWSSEQTSAEIERVVDLFKTRHQVDLLAESSTHV